MSEIRDGYWEVEGFYLQGKVDGVDVWAKWEPDRYQVLCSALCWDALKDRFYELLGPKGFPLRTGSCITYFKTWEDAAMDASFCFDVLKSIAASATGWVERNGQTIEFENETEELWPPKNPSEARFKRIMAGMTGEADELPGLKAKLVRSTSGRCMNCHAKFSARLMQLHRPRHETARLLCFSCHPLRDMLWPQ